MRRESATLILACEVLLSCASVPTNPVSYCDKLVSKEINEVYSSVDRRTAETIRVDIEGSKYAWGAEPSFARVRELVNRRGGHKDFVRLEVGRTAGTRYNSIWFVADDSQVREFVTGAEVSGVEERGVPLAEWQEYKKHLLKMASVGLSSKVSSAISDSPVYFFSAHLDGSDFAFVLEVFPERLLQFDVIVRTLRLSGVKTVPRELAILYPTEGPATSP